ncbi:SAND family protein [Aphelenchoides besseyi]|nr:SAND family protein [Aphelenchoides besseyi]
MAVELTTSSHHIWILSEFGKPIFGSIGDESELVRISPVIGTFVRTYESWDDQLHSIQMDGLYVHFSYRSPIILCIVSHEPSNLKWHLDVIYNQVISILTKFALRKTYEERGGNFDLRRYLTGIDKRFDVCLKSFELDPVVYLSGFRILPMNYADREFIVNTMASCINASTSTVAFAVLIAHRQLIALVRMKKLNLTSSDFNILANLVECHESLRDVETWVPLCLPHFNKNQFLYAHISYLWENNGPCLIMLSSSRDAFYDLKVIRENISQTIGTYKRCLRLKATVSQPDHVFTKQVLSIDLFHFMYKNILSSQVCCSSPQKPFITPLEQSQLYKGYFKLMDLVRKSKNVAYFFQTQDDYALFAWRFKMSNPFDDDDDKPTKSYTSKNSETADEMARRYEQQLETLMQESLSSTQRSVKALDSSEQLGTQAARDLLAQREKLERTERNLDDINHTTHLTQRSLNSLKSVFGGFFKNKFSKAPPKPNHDVPPSASSGKLSSTLDQQSEVPPGSNPFVSANSAPSLSAESRQHLQGTRWGAMDDEIDENLGQMSDQLKRLRALGTALGEEVEDQNQMLDRIESKAARNDSVVRNQDQQMKKLLGYKPTPAQKRQMVQPNLYQFYGGFSKFNPDILIQPSESPTDEDVNFWAGDNFSNSAREVAAVITDFLEAYFHEVVCRYGRYPQSSKTTHAVQGFFYTRCMDPNVCDYYKKCRPTFRRWFLLQKIESVVIAVLNSDTEEVVAEFRVCFFRPKTLEEHGIAAYKKDAKNLVEQFTQTLDSFQFNDDIEEVHKLEKLFALGPIIQIYCKLNADVKLPYADTEHLWEVNNVKPPTSVPQLVKTNKIVRNNLVEIRFHNVVYAESNNWAFYGLKPEDFTQETTVSSKEES